jgi:hypothetical protein
VEGRATSYHREHLTMITGMVKEIDGLTLVVEETGGTDHVLKAISKTGVTVFIDGKLGYVSQIKPGDTVRCYGDPNNLHTIKVGPVPDQDPPE